MKRITALLLISLGSASQAFAQLPSAPSNHSRWYGSIGLGYAKTADIISGGDLQNVIIQGYMVTSCNCSYSNNESDHDVSWQLTAGYRLSRIFRMEVFYTDFGNVESKAGFNGTATVTGYPFAGTLKLKNTVRTWASGLAVSAGYPITDRFRLYARLGAFYYKTGATIKVNLTDTYYGAPYNYSASEKDSTDGSGSLAGLGASYSIGSSYVIALEWNRYNHIRAYNQTTNIDVIDGSFRVYF